MMSSPSSSGPGVSPLCYRLKMYKMTTPPWKETVRQRCLQRLRDNRQRLVGRLRDEQSGQSSSIAVSLLRQEWDALNKFEDLDKYISIYEEIEEELKQEEARMVEEMLDFEQQAIDAAVHSFYEKSPICPNCMVSNLSIDSTLGRVSCQNCWLDVQTGPLPILSEPDALRRRLEHLFCKHGLMCSEKPSFVTQTFACGRQQLVAQCGACGARDDVF